MKEQRYETISIEDLNAYIQKGRKARSDAFMVAVKWIKRRLFFKRVMINSQSVQCR